MKWLGVTVLCLGLALSAQAPLAAQQGITRKQADEILRKLDQIIKLLDQPVRGAAERVIAEPEHPDRVKVNVGSLPSIGRDGAPVTVVEFTDLQCLSCAKFHAETYPKIRQVFVDTGKVRFVHWDLPLAMHPDAEEAAEAGRCAGEQGQFWEMRDWMQAHPTRLAIENLRGQAIEMQLDLDEFRWCLVTAKYREAIKSAVEEARGLQITGAPAFVIGKTADILDGEVMIGPLPYQAFEDKLNALLK